MKIKQNTCSRENYVLLPGLLRECLSDISVLKKMISKVVLLPENPGRLTDRFWIIDGYEILKIPWQLTDKTALVFSGPYFPEFGLNTEIYGVNLHIYSEYRKIRTRKNSVFGHFSRSTNYGTASTSLLHTMIWGQYFNHIRASKLTFMVI